MKIPFLEFPRSLNFRTLDAFSQALVQVRHLDQVGIDFRVARWGTPFFLAASGILIAEHKVRTGQRLHCINFEHCSYFAHMGFFTSFGLAHGKLPGQASGSSNYLPINIIDSDEIRAEAEERDCAVGLVMEARAESLARILARKDDGPVVDALTFSVREMFRNIVEHSEADRLAYCAQAYPNRGHVEVGVFDLGRGLKAGLEENRKMSFEDDSGAIRCALMPGVSGKAEKVKRLRVKDAWTNSGYGLYMTSRLFRDHGSMSICSGNSGLILSGNDVISAPWSMRGTAIRLLLVEKRINDLNDQLAQYKREGAKARQEIGGAGLSEPSIASTSLARNFSGS